MAQCNRRGCTDQARWLLSSHSNGMGGNPAYGSLQVFVCDPHADEIEARERTAGHRVTRSAWGEPPSYLRTIMSNEARNDTIRDLSSRLQDALVESTDAPAALAPGIYVDVPMSVYHQLAGASNSQLNKLYGRTPAHLRAALDEPKPDTKALRIGRALHTAILEPDLFSKQFAVAGQCEATLASGKNAGDRCKNAGTHYSNRDGWRCGVHPTISDESRIVVPQKDYDICIGARDSVFRHGMAGPLLKRVGNVEQTLVWNDQKTGLLCRARHDFHTEYIPGGGVADLKSTEDASMDAFMWSMWKYGYGRQGALYLEGAHERGLPLQNFLIIAVEKSPPYAVNVFILDDGSLDASAKQLRPLKRLYKRCLDTNEWPAYDDSKIHDIALPHQVFEQIDAETQGEQ